MQPALTSGFCGAVMLTSLAYLALPYPHLYIPSQSGPVPPQTSDYPTVPSIGLFMGVSDQLPSESAWTDDHIPLLVTGVICQLYDQQAILVDPDGIPPTTEMLKLNVSLSLLLLGGSSFLRFGLEDICYRAR